MRKFLLPLLLIASTFVWATPPTITIDGDKSDWAEVPMISEPGIWPMLKVIPAADANLGTNALAYMMENTADFDPTWAQYPTEFIDKDYDKSTAAIAEYWAFKAMGIDYKATTGVDNGGWISFPKAMSADNKVFEIGFPATYITDLGSKFGFAMCYNSGAWFCPDYSSPAVSPSNGFLYKNRSFSTMPCTLTMTNVFAHQSIGECVDYVDFGLRDNGNDTARWAAWPIELTKLGKYDVTANVTSGNSWSFECWLVDVASNAVVAHLPNTGDIASSKTSEKLGTLDLTSVPAGKYMLKVKNKTRHSTVKLNSVELAYVGGALINIPETLKPVDALRSEYAFVNGDGEFRFTDDGNDGYVTSQWGKWNIHVSKAGFYNFTLNANSDNSHKYYLSILNPDESEIIKYTLNGSSGTALSKTTDNLELAEGDYIVMIQNYITYSHGRVINIVANYAGGAVVEIPETLAPADAILSSNAGIVAGTPDYIDFNALGGSRQNVPDEWAKWKIKVTTEAKYLFTAHVTSTNSQKYTLSVLNSTETGTPLVELAQTGDIGSGDQTFSTDAIVLPVGEYVVKIVNTYPWSNGGVKDIVASYAGGGTVNIPGTLNPVDALRSEYAFINDDGEFRFTDDDHDGHILDQWGKWNIHVSKAGFYNFTLNANSDNSHKYYLSILNPDESEIIKYTLNGSSGTALSKTTDNLELTEGDYIVKIQNYVANSHGRVINIVANYAGGAIIEVPENVLLAAEAVIVDNGHLKMHKLANGDLQYDDNGNPEGEYAFWKIHATEAGSMTVALNFVLGNSTGHIYRVELYEGSTFKSSSEEAACNWDEDVTLTNPLVIPAAGDYTLRLINKQANSSNVFHSITLTPASIELDENADNSGLISTEAANPQPKRIALKRSLVANNFNTFCVPFAISADEMARVFPGAQILGMTDATLDGGVLDLLFDDAVSMEAGKPYLIKPAAAIVNPEFRGVTISVEAPVDVVGAKAKFIGLFSPSTIPASEYNLFLGPDDTLYFPDNGDKAIKGIRGWFKVGVPSSVISRARIVQNGQETTAIDLVGSQNNETIKTIENGQLVIIRDGVRYNVMGIRIQ